ncbi:MAG: ribokinase [Clostridia bacterium]|nr:ribokinase [Clostridia bacterium]
MKNILVIGSANIDLTIQTDRMPKLGETVAGHGFSMNSGGKGANQAVAAAKLGGDVKFLGVIGNDTYGEKLLADLRKSGAVFEGITADGVPTGTACITVVNGDNFIVLNPGANDLLTPEIIEEKAELIRKSDYVIMQLEIPVDSVLRAAVIAKDAGTSVVLNPAPVKELPDEIYRLTDIMIPNEYEAKLLTGISTDNEQGCRAAVEDLRKKGVKTVIITLGDRGCVYNDGDRIIFHPAGKADVVDTTSAGDSFIGALCCKLSSGNSLPESIDYATKVAAVTVSRRGASESIPYAYEI